MIKLSKRAGEYRKWREDLSSPIARLSVLDYHILILTPSLERIFTQLDFAIAKTEDVDVRDSLKRVYDEVMDLWAAEDVRAFNLQKTSSMN